MSSETSHSKQQPPTGGFSGFLKKSWYALLVFLNAGFWNTVELVTPHRKFDVKKVVRRPGDNVVVTGGARGIGKEIVRKLLMLDMHVILGVRNETAAKTMIDEFRKARITTGTVDILPLDLKSFASVREFATQILQKYSKLHLLINNAGIYEAPYEITEDGYEVTFQVNYLSHFLLTNMLLPKLTYGGTQEKPSRVVHVSSIAHYQGKLDFNDLWMQKNYGTNWAYGNSKLMQAVFSNDLNDRLVKDGSFVRSFAVHPGCVNSGLYDSYPKFIRGMFWLMFKSNEQGADGVLYCALAPEAEKDAGKYFQNCAKYFTNSQVTNLEVQKKLWEASCKACGWQDSPISSKPKTVPTRKNTPAIVITKDSGTESISSAKSAKITKDDLEREGDINEESVQGRNGEHNISSSEEESLNKNYHEEKIPNKIEVTVTSKEQEVTSTTTSLGEGTTGVNATPPTVGGSE